MIFSQDTDIKIDKILWVYKDIDTKSWKYTSVDKNFHRLLLVVKGSAFWKNGSTTYHAKKGDVIWLPPYFNYHAFNDELPFTYLSFTFLIQDEAFPCTEAWNPLFLNTDYELMNKLFSAALNSFIFKKPGFQIEIKALLLNVIYHICSVRTSYLTNVSVPKIIKKGYDYMNQHYYETNLSINKLAEMCHISVKHFSRVFSDSFHIAPKKYLLDIRIEQAKNLLAFTPESVSKISALTGFSDVYHFSKTFKKFVGCSPRKYREKFPKN